MAMWPGATGGVDGGWPGRTLIRGEGRVSLGGGGSERQRETGALLSILECINNTVYLHRNALKERSMELDNEQKQGFTTSHLLEASGQCVLMSVCFKLITQLTQLHKDKLITVSLSCAAYFIW